MTLRIVLALVLLADVVTAIGIVFARHEHRQLFIELSRLEKARDDLNIEFGRLQLEQATWAENSRIEQIARGRLGMVSPGAAELVVTNR